MAKGKKAVEIPPERVEEIRRDARSGTNWAEAYWNSKHPPRVVDDPDDDDAE